MECQGGEKTPGACCRRHRSTPSCFLFPPPLLQQIKSALNKTAIALDKTAANKAAWLNRTAETKLAAVNATLSAKAGKV